MKFYVATRSIVDAINGYHVSSGTIVQTENLNWIKRFGSAFREIAAPDNPEILEDVVFVRDAGKVEPKKELVVEAAEPVEAVEAEEPVDAAVEQSEDEEAEEEDDSASEGDTLSTDSAAPVVRKRIKKKLAKK